MQAARIIAPGIPDESTVENVTATGEYGLFLSFGTSGENEKTSREGNSLILRVPLPILGGPCCDPVFLSAPTGPVECLDHGFWKMLRFPDGTVCGAASLPFSVGKRSATARQLYLQLFSQLLPGERLYRIWNFVPRINEEQADLENYRAFNIGRWQAFEESNYLSQDGNLHPAASAVGVRSDCLSVCFIGGTESVEYFENPCQIPAWQYPDEYGPKSPCFVRGTVVGGDTAYLSGTASIVGHRSQSVSDLEGQFRTTMENVDLMLEKMGTNRHHPMSRFRIYVRNPEDFPRLAQWWQREVPAEVAERTSFLQSDICRSELLLEIEAIVPGL